MFKQEDLERDIATGFAASGVVPSRGLTLFKKDDAIQCCGLGAAFHAKNPDISGLWHAWLVAGWVETQYEMSRAECGAFIKGWDSSGENPYEAGSPEDAAFVMGRRLANKYLPAGEG